MAVSFSLFSLFCLFCFSHFVLLFYWVLVYANKIKFSYKPSEKILMITASPQDITNRKELFNNVFMYNVDWHYCLHLALWLFSINEPILLLVCASGTCQSIYYFSREAILHIEISHNLHHIISLRGSNIEITIKMSFVTLDTLWNQTAS